MVKGISRQVIVVQSPDKKLFEQAIFILKDDAVGVTDEQLMKEAQQAIRNPKTDGKRKLWYYGPAWACAGAVLTGIAWIITALI
ncbi:MAG: hypothetical protein IJZ15_07065 [Oscillospiraceae bacterium]|nr:hypothetical protein [Oscillospiraceae bacterium]